MSLSGGVVVLDGQTNYALACVRSLGRAGYPVFVASTRRAPVAAWSRYSHASFQLSGDTVQAYAALRDWALAHGVTAVLPLTERSCQVCDADRQAWEAAGIVVGCAPGTTLIEAFDKARTLERAAANGVRTPPTWAPSSLAEGLVAAEAVGFPCVIKPRFTHAWDGRQFLPAGRPSYPRGLEETEAALLAARQGDHWPLVQGFVPGQGKGVFALCDHGRAVAWFAHERLRDVRPAGSGSSLRRSIRLDARLQEPAARLLAALRWHGPAMVEFRDDEKQAPWLMEVNGRFWNSLELAVRAGADFPRWWLALLRGEAVPPVPAYREGVTLRWWWGDIKRLLYIMAGPPAGYPGKYPTMIQGLREVFGPQPPGTTSDSWDPQDRWPALGEMVQASRDILGRITNGTLPRRNGRQNGSSVVQSSGSPGQRAGGGMPPSTMRVLMITADYPMPDGAPRTTVFVKRQADFLTAAGVAVDVFPFIGGQRGWNYLRAWLRLRAHLKRGPRYDIIHAQFGQSGLLALPKRHPLVVTFRGSDLLGIVKDTTGRRTWKGRIAQALSRFVATRADSVIVVSEHMKASLPPRVSAHVIPSGLDLKQFRPKPRDEARQGLGLAPDKRYVLFIGNPDHPRKRVELARRAVALASEKVPAELIVLWLVQHDLIPSYMSACDALICTSLQEGSPNVVKEALACDLPVVSVAVGDVPERLRGIEGCEVTADDRPETIAAALERVLRRGGRVAGRQAVAHLDEHLLTQRVIGIYRAAMNGTTSPEPAASPLVVREASAAELAAWDSIAERFPGCRVVHTRAWMRSLEDSGKGQPLYLVFQKDGEIVGCLPGLIARVGPFRLFGSPLPGWQSVSMGPLLDPARVSTRDLLAALVPALEQRWGVHHVELLCTNLDAADMNAAGFRGEPVYTYRAPLFPGDEARSLKGMKDSARRNIKRAEKLGLVTVFEEDEAFLNEHIDQVTEVFRRGGNSMPMNRNRLEQYFRHMRDSGRLIAASVYLPDPRVRIATGMFTIHGKELLLWTWAHREQYRWYRPTELLTWKIMQRAMAAGCTTLDFMGRGDFKAKFGAELDGTHYRWVRSRYGWLTALRDLAQRTYRWQQALRGRLARGLRPAPPVLAEPAP
jgi:glycosyltransferase involved in cell wall biosynthesis/predicted ATP-grasp superfamily ATP-dependent carboligase/CelD/BcsL family acetyltransferase involved in cellulose biosynthesis